MQLEYYTLPLALEKIPQKETIPKCTLQQSVMQHLHLLLTTGFGEFPVDEAFGCGIWDYDFDNVTSVYKVKEIIRQSLLSSIQQKERRLSNIKVDLTMQQQEIADGSMNKRVKKKIDITIIGTLLLTNERIQFTDSFFVGPLSY